MKLNNISNLKNKMGGLAREGIHSFWSLSVTNLNMQSFPAKRDVEY